MEEEILEELMEACRRGRPKTVQGFIFCIAFLSHHDWIGRSPLHYASRQGHLDIVQLLISNTQRYVNDRDKDGNTPLHEACRRGYLKIAQCLISDGHCKVNISNHSGSTPLHLACRNGHLNIVKYLSSEGQCNVNCSNNSGETPLHLSCMEGYFDIVQCLITEGHCGVNISNSSGETALHWACRKNHLSIVKCLVTEGHCDVNISNTSGETPLHWACRYGLLEVVQLLISDRNCDVNSTDANGDTSLHYVCRQGEFNILKVLINDAHCDVTIGNNSEETPLHVACRENYAQTVHYLLSERLYTIEKDDRTLLNLTNDPSTIKELLRHGANPENVYAEYSRHLPKHSPKKPPEPAVKIFAVGDHGTGKSTLVKALEKEGGGFSHLAGRLKKVTKVDDNTAGIIPHKFESRRYGHVTLYDFAGHKEFYASHAAMIRQSMAGSSTAIFLLVADLRTGDKQFEGSILSWLSFIDNQCPLDPKPHIIIVGSHADEIESKGESGVAKSSIVNSLEHRDAFRRFEFRGFIAINCCYSQSSSIAKLRQKLARSCEALRLKSKLSFNTHCFLIYLLDRFQDLEAVKLKDVLIKVSENSALAKSEQTKLLSFVPTDAPRLWEMCEDLHDRGSILLLRNTAKRDESWLILDQTALLKTVPGKVFAPKSFKDHQDLASATGVVPFMKFRDHFPTLDPDMVAQFLCHLEFCQEVTDDEVLQLLQTPLSISCNEKVFFFPSLVSIDTPELQKYSPAQIPAQASRTQIWKPSSECAYTSGWILECSTPEHHFTPRFLQVLLLRLAFNLALVPHIQDIGSDYLEIQREFGISKRGICWRTQDGVRVLVEMDGSCKILTVLFQCLGGREIECIYLRSTVIHKALCAREEFCPKVSTSEYFIHPDDIEYPLKPTTELSLFSISQIATALTAGDSCIIGKDNLPVDLEKLLYFEPYSHLTVNILQDLFHKKAVSSVVDEFIHRMAQCFDTKVDHFEQMFSALKLPVPTAMQHAPPNPTQAIIQLLQLWYLRSRKDIYQCLHSLLDQFSIFGGRNPFSPTSSSLSSQPTAETSIEIESNTDNYSTIIDSADESTLDIKSLLEVRGELRQVNIAWLDFGLALALPQHTLKMIKSEEGNSQCLTETLAAWLQGRDGAAAPTWRAVVKALLSPTINFQRLAQQISTEHQCNDSESSSVTGSEDSALEDVDNTTLDENCLIDVKPALLAGGRDLAWFELGLALGLYYGTLKVIQSEYSKDDEYLTGTLAAWLEQKDRVPQQGVPSWHSLTRALAHPLVSQQGLAQEIARKHPKVNKSEENRSTTGKSESNNRQVFPDESSSRSGTSQGEDGCSSKCFLGSSDPLTVDIPKQLERISKDEESTTSQTEGIHVLPEEMANTATKIPMVFSSAPPTHTPTSPPPSEDTVIAGIVRNQQEFTGTQDPNASTTGHGDVP